MFVLIVSPLFNYRLLCAYIQPCWVYQYHGICSFASSFRETKLICPTFYLHDIVTTPPSCYLPLVMDLSCPFCPLASVNFQFRIFGQFALLSTLCVWTLDCLILFFFFLKMNLNNVWGAWWCEAPNLILWFLKGKKMTKKRWTWQEHTHKKKV